MARAMLLAAVAACALSGCGTMRNVSGGCCGGSSPKAVYGGVRLDAAAVCEYGGKMGEAKGPGDAVFTGAIAACIALDMTLSAVGDTVTLPITLLASVGGRGDKGHGDDEGGPATRAEPSARSPALPAPLPPELPARTPPQVPVRTGSE